MTSPTAAERAARYEAMVRDVTDLQKRVRELEAFVAILRAALTGGSPNGVGAIATAADLDGKYGNPKVRCDPKDWKDAGGLPRKGRLMNQCEPEFLDLYAETLEFFAQKNDAEGKKATNGKPASFYDRADAARARGWAKRLREGWQPKATQAAQAPSTTTRWGTSGWGSRPQESTAPSSNDQAVIDDPYADREDTPSASASSEYPPDWDVEDDRIEVG